MIALERIRTEEAVNLKYRGLGKKSTDKELMFAQRAFLNDSNKKIEFKTTYWKTAKVQLKKESKGKCAYCEANAEVVAHGDVEHYRPKSTYWWLAYTYDNYLYACQICNQSYKSDNFPIGGNLLAPPPVLSHSLDHDIDQLLGNISPDPLEITSKYTLQKYIDGHISERAYLLNPYFDNPVIYFAYEADDIIGEVKIVPTKPQYEQYVKAAEDFYGINRIELKNIRYSIYTKFKAFKRAYHVLTDMSVKEEVGRQIDDMISDNYLFSGMNRYYNNLF